MLMESAQFRFNRRFQQYTKGGTIKGARYDQPSAEITLSGNVTGTGTDAHSAVQKGHGTAITTDFVNWSGSTAIHGFTPTDGVNVFESPERNVTEDNASLTWIVRNFPGMS